MNGFTHFIGILAAVAGMVILLVATETGKTTHVVSFSIFGAAMIMMYTSSTLYHWLPLSSKKIKFMRKIDHIMIYVMIAGSYTPICLILLKGAWGWSIFGISWGITVVGAILKINWINMPRKLNVALYLAMGWIIIIAMPKLNSVTSNEGILWLMIEGLTYSTGAVVYASKKPNFKYFGFHETWHLFVLGGSFAHFWFLLKYVLPI